MTLKPLNFSGHCTVVNNLQLHKEPAPIVFTLLGIVMFSMAVL